MAVPKKKRSRKYYHFKLNLNIIKGTNLNPVVLNNKLSFVKKLPALAIIKEEVVSAPNLV